MTLVEFLRARYDEAQRVAEAAAKGEWQASQSEYSAGRIEAWEPDGTDWSMVIYDEGGHTGADAAHIVAWQPSRVLADIAGKRAILELHHPRGTSLVGVSNGFDNDFEEVEPDSFEEIVSRDVV